METVLDKLENIVYFPYRYIRNIVYPKKCVFCGRIVKENEWICPVCETELEFIDKKKRCIKCGHPKDKCCCKKRVFYFEGLVSVFENRDLAQKGFYRYKFSRKMHYATYFAKVMGDAVKAEFCDIKFDYICCVPQSIKSFLKRGFEHSNLLCQELSKVLEVPVMHDVLSCKDFARFQHKSSRKQRAKNVKNKYYTIGKVSGTVLLVDDITTTGLTLDACARQLLYAGADKVYCVSALIAPK